MPTDPLRDRIAQTLADMDGPVDADRLAGDILVLVREAATSDAAVKRFRELIGAETNCYLTLVGAEAAIMTALGGGDGG